MLAAFKEEIAQSWAEVMGKRGEKESPPEKQNKETEDPQHIFSKTYFYRALCHY